LVDGHLNPHVKPEQGIAACKPNTEEMGPEPMDFLRQQDALLNMQVVDAGPASASELDHFRQDSRRRSFGTWNPSMSMLKVLGAATIICLRPKTAFPWMPGNITLEPWQVTGLDTLEQVGENLKGTHSAGRRCGRWDDPGDYREYPSYLDSVTNAVWGSLPRVPPSLFYFTAYSEV
jgi:hypothetical protein